MFSSLIARRRLRPPTQWRHLHNLSFHKWVGAWCYVLDLTPWFNLWFSLAPAELWPARFVGLAKNTLLCLIIVIYFIFVFSLWCIDVWLCGLIYEAFHVILPCSLFSCFFSILFSIVITSLGEERAGLCASRACACLSYMCYFLCFFYFFLLAAAYDCGSLWTFHLTFSMAISRFKVDASYTNNIKIGTANGRDSL